MAQHLLPYQDSKQPIELRVQDLMHRMSAEEKFRQLFMVCGDLNQDSASLVKGLFGFQVSTTSLQTSANNQMLHYTKTDDAKQLLQKINSIQQFFIQESSLGIPIIAFDEALHGLVRQQATAFPQAIAMAASFDTNLMHRVCHAIALETKARGIRMVLSPVLNLATDVRWGRVEETYGEDPWLCSQMGLHYVSAMEENGILATPKHFIVNHGEGGRDSYPISINRRFLSEFYLKPFREVIQKGHASAIMTAYNSYDGKPCSANSFLLKEILRKQLGFTGIVISDAGGTGGANVLHFTAKDYEDAGKQSIENGLDVIFQSSFSSYPLFKKPFVNKEVNSSSIDSALYRVLYKKMELGLFDNPYVSEKLLASINKKSHQQLAYQMAIESAVLLKNKRGLLPITSTMKRIGVFGQDATEIRLGGYSGLGQSPISILDGLKDRLQSQHPISYSLGCQRQSVTHEIVPPTMLFHKENNKLKSGLQAAYFNNTNLQEPAALQRLDENIQFQWTLFGPSPEINYDFFSVRWEGFLIPSESVFGELGIEGNDGWKLYIDDALFLDRSNEQSFNTTLKPFNFTKNKTYKIRIEYVEKSGNSIFRLIWNPNKSKEQQLMDEAIRLAAQQDLNILVAGIQEGEFQDRSSLRLPGRQEEFIQKLLATGKPLVVVLVGGSAITMDPWIEQVDAVIDVWYPGEQGGLAIADLLCGKANPSGKLPITFPKSEGQLPLVYNHLPTGRGDDYLNETGQALFPFGYGLSYTQFDYSNLRVQHPIFHASDTVELSFNLTNTGQMAGDEVVQCYVHDEIARFARPIKELKNFQRIHLNVGESKDVRIKLTADQLSYPDEAMNDLVEEGSFRIMIGSSSKDIRLRTLIEYIHE